MVTVPAAPSTEQRLLDATLACLARHGIAKTTLDDVAREAGVSRATLYRYFPGKQALLAAAVATEAARMVAAIDAAGAGTTDLEDAVVAMMRTAAYELSHQAALQFALAHEPEQVLPHLAFAGGDAFLAAASSAFAPSLARFLPPERVPRAAEWCARMVLTVLEPREQALIADDDVVRDMVREFVIPGLVPESLRTVQSKG
ncbi:MAG: TetR/AcrR family transcriptional regulator [Actinomycetes bacterium]